MTNIRRPNALRRSPRRSADTKRKAEHEALMMERVGLLIFAATATLSAATCLCGDGSTEDAGCCPAVTGTCDECTCDADVEATCEDLDPFEPSYIGFYICGGVCLCDPGTISSSSGLAFGFNTPGTTDPPCQGPYCCSASAIQAGLAASASAPAIAAPPSPAIGASIMQDPHMRLAHDGEADFRGKQNTLYNYLSAPGLSVNVLTEEALYTLHDGKLLVNGTYMTEVHVATLVEGKTQVGPARPVAPLP